MSVNLIQSFPGFDIKADVELANYTNTKVGGHAEWVFWPKSVEQLRYVLVELQNLNQTLPITVLGNASNIIVTDQGLAGLVIFLTNLTSIEVHDQQIKAGAGAWLIDVTRQAQRHNLAGLEWAAGIPGSVGGAVYMNAGAYGGQVDAWLESVEVLTPTGELQTLTTAQLAFAYRHSVLHDTDDVIVSATFKLKPGEASAIDALMEDYNTRRASKQPLEFPSCGSVFKRPEGHFAGKLIMDAGLQGYQVGGAQVSTKHAGFIVNKGNATATDYIAVIKHVQTIIKEQYEIDLETEVKIFGA
ncbi:MAG: UDP-N-acetylmuramate dehydrogenase [Lactobacillaceae bacterium]|jgi:UDP-N-acetylmuramate dehydrogenase|nr:UDP-N-acetylmuramate dehydrogenase [Lactobacillaceae bacterium]